MFALNVSYNEDTARLFDRALLIYGRQSQLGKAQEECGELVAAIGQEGNGKISELEVCSEIADVFITALQAARIYGEDIVKQQILEKLTKFKHTVDEDSTWD
jgi:NTP pyrophosphatase (non-canonical NTP hydrolase)